MIFISKNDYIQKFLFNNLGNMGKQEVINLYLSAFPTKPESFTKNRSIINSKYFQFREYIFTDTIIKNSNDI